MKIGALFGFPLKIKDYHCFSFFLKEFHFLGRKKYFMV